MSGPTRIQLRRAKGWRIPPNTVNVARPNKFGNPFTVAQAIESEFANEATARGFVVECFRDWLTSSRGRDWWQGPESDARKAAILDGVAELRGKNLACWCPLPKPGEPDVCHAAILLELANK